MTSERPQSMLLLTGLLCDDRIWSPVAAFLAHTLDIKIVTFSGLSSIEAMAERVLSEMPDQAILAGHSMGGRVAIEAFSQAPDRVAGMILVNTGVHPTTAQEPQSRQRLIDLANTEGMKALANEWLPPMVGSSPERTALLMPDLISMVEANTPISFAGQIAALLERPNAQNALARVRVPLLLMSAENDCWSPPAQHKEMLKIAPHGQLKIITDAGHMAPIEQPERVASALSEWIEEQWPVAI